MKVTYKKLWKKMIDLEMTKTELREKTGISTVTLAKLGKDQVVSMEVLMKICKALECNIDEICDFVEV
ncbi:MAG: helix-turn-helix transcriptional regulator [Clostridia bacterium]|nr:helix-turn-helix transcriptional regulator [Clostridia bacterium]